VAVWTGSRRVTGKLVTEGVRYFRLHGRGGYRYQYSDAELRELLAKAMTEGNRERTSCSTTSEPSSRLTPRPQLPQSGETNVRWLEAEP